jgi:transposase
MDDRTLYKAILGLEEPWYVEGVEVGEGEVRVRLDRRAEARLECPECSRAVRGYDRSPERQWRHLDTCQYRTVLTARIPRVECPEHGVRQIHVPWAEDRSRFTALFEAWAIRLLQETTTLGLTRLMGLSWDEAEGILDRAVRRGLDRRTGEPARVLGIDETSYQKRHEYVTVVSDLERGRVLWIGDSRKKETLTAYYNELERDELAGIEEVVMDMWEPPRDCRRLQSLRGWGHEQAEEVRTRGAGSGRRRP